VGGAEAEQRLPRQFWEADTSCYRAVAIYSDAQFERAALATSFPPDLAMLSGQYYQEVQKP